MIDNISDKITEHVVRLTTPDNYRDDLLLTPIS